ncbi:MAG: beta-glucosidase, partial [Rhodothermia bacterium]|nr:beta-glucosidase [Rhodothermia bacterium]
MRRPSSLLERAAQLLFIRIGSNMNPPIRAHEEADRVAEIIERCPIGGLLLFNGRFRETGKALQRLQKISRFPLVVAADLERGAGQQLKGATIFPHAMALSAQAELAVTDAYDMGRITAREALSEGVHYILGPVADLNRNPKNPIIGTRAFGRDPQRVATLVRAYVEGCRAEGCVVAPKHFPGHGNTDADSHSDVPVIGGSREEFDEIDLVPFREAIAAGCETVMTAHAAYPGLDPSGRVATRSAVILNDLLRNTLGFGGAVVSDSLLMDGVRRSYA